MPVEKSIIDSKVGARASFDITPSDSAQFSYVTRGIYVGGSGNLKVQFVDGGIATLQNVVAGTVYPFFIVQVFSTGTTATNLIGLL